MDVFVLRERFVVVTVGIGIPTYHSRMEFALIEASKGWYGFQEDDLTMIAV
ncbi:MAG: hypothetical protein R6U13_05525 [Desulfatiglandaceae bacterium]